VANLYAKFEIRIPNRTRSKLFCSCDLDLDPMTLIYELDLDILKLYLHIINEPSRSRYSTKVRARMNGDKCSEILLAAVFSCTAYRVHW